MNFNKYIETKPMKKGKKKWGYRCNYCRETFNSEEHKEYTIIDTFKLQHEVDLSLLTVHEGTMFCSARCAIDKIKAHYTE